MSRVDSFSVGDLPNCPPADAIDADLLVYRTVSNEPPTESDFLKASSKRKVTRTHSWRARSQALPGNGLGARLCLAAPTSRTSGRQSLPDSAFPGGAWERGA
jgi:hypothetical protein